MVMKTIRVSEENHGKLSGLGLKSETYDDIITRLIDAYEILYFDELTDKEADYCNKRIMLFEKGNREGTRKVDLDAIRRK